MKTGETMPDPGALLRRLIEEHFSCAELEWNYIEGTDLQDIDPELHKEITEYINTH